jgi:hypothetical protein
MLLLLLLADADIRLLLLESTTADLRAGGYGGRIVPTNLSAFAIKYAAAASDGADTSSYSDSTGGTDSGTQSGADAGLDSNAAKSAANTRNSHSYSHLQVEIRVNTAVEEIVMRQGNVVENCICKESLNSLDNTEKKPVKKT